MSTWRSDVPLHLRPLTAANIALALLRGVPVAVVVLGGLVLHLALRAIERLLFGRDRPITPWITQGVCRATLLLLGLRCETRGRPVSGRCALVSNHVSWLDIFVLNARDRFRFVSKAEVAGWPLIGWLARATGTVFIRRDPREAGSQRQALRRALEAGQRLLFFPEGTSTDGLRILRFKSALFDTFCAQGFETLPIQPVTIEYSAPPGQDPRYYGWWGDMPLAPSLLRILGTTPQGRVRVSYHAPLRAIDHANRKTLAASAETMVRGGLRGRTARA